MIAPAEHQPPWWLIPTYHPRRVTRLRNNGQLAYGVSPPAQLAYSSEGGLGALPHLRPALPISFYGGWALVLTFSLPDPHLNRLRAARSVSNGLRGVSWVPTQISTTNENGQRSRWLVRRERFADLRASLAGCYRLYPNDPCL
jgi:hypothetical protein